METYSFLIKAFSLKDAFAFGVENYCGIADTNSYTNLTNIFRYSGMDLSTFVNINKKSCPEGTCYVICTKKPSPNINKLKAKITHTATPGRKHWFFYYSVYEKTENGKTGLIYSFLNKREAFKCAIDYTERTKLSTYIKIDKTMSSGSPIIAHINYFASAGEQEGEYIFFGNYKK